MSAEAAAGAEGSERFAALMPPSSARRRLLAKSSSLVDEFLEELPGLPVSSDVDLREIRQWLAQFDFGSPVPVDDVIDACAHALRRWNVHNTHPRYFGLFNPPSAFPGVIADLLVAAFNPQLAVWSQAPAANEIEQHVVRFLGATFGYAPDAVGGAFTTGGSEANFTGVLVALSSRFPGAIEEGVRSLDGQPLIYASQEAHHSLLKIAHQCGLGRAAVRAVPTDASLRLDVSRLREWVEADRRAGHLPFLVVATAGTTSTGTIDPLERLADVCAADDLHLHVDAAYGGAAVLSEAMRPHLLGVARADSVTVDAHKWWAAPMAAGILICRDRADLRRTFDIAGSYMPASTPGTIDPYTHSVQWSRRFTGLKVFMSLAAVGRGGYAAMIDSQVRLGDHLRSRARERGWQVVNETPLPVVCIADPSIDERAGDDAPAAYSRMAREIVRRGNVWVSSALAGSRACLRACITSFMSDEEDVEALVAELETARENALGS